MSEDIKIEDLQENEVLTQDTEQYEAEETTEEVEETVEQDPLKAELERVHNKSGNRTELEKALFKQNQIAKRIRELRGTEEDFQDDFIEDEDDKPVTIGMLKRLQAESAVNTALSLANDIENEVERELVVFHLENTIKSTGNPKDDLKLARALVNSVKNSQIAEEVVRKAPAKQHSSGSGVNGKHEERIELTSEELMYTKAPFNMKPEDIIKTRQKG